MKGFLERIWLWPLGVVSAGHKTEVVGGAGGVMDRDSCSDEAGIDSRICVMVLQR